MGCVGSVEDGWQERRIQTDEQARAWRAREASEWYMYMLDIYRRVQCAEELHNAYVWEIKCYACTPVQKVPQNGKKGAVQQGRQVGMRGRGSSGGEAVVCVYLPLH